MKKYLLSLIPLSVAGASTAIIVPVVVHQLEAAGKPLNQSNISRFKEIQQDSSIPFVEYKLNKQSDIINSLNSADINLFYNSAGAITTVYMQQLSLLAAAGSATGSQVKEVHYALAPDAWEPQAKLNQDELTRILKLANQNSSIINVHSDNNGRIISEWAKIIMENPDKKINVWWNSDHLNHANGDGKISIMDLTAFSNVNIHLLEDGAAISDLLTQSLTDQNLDALKNDELTFEGSNQYILPAKFDNVRSWFTPESVNSFIPNFDFIGHFYAKDLPEGLFNTRIMDNGVNTRLSSYWTKVSGNDWHKVLDTMTQAAKDFPGKKNLLILGSYGSPREEEYIKYIYTKYHDTYNIFYKGHPGHMEHTDYVNNDLIRKENFRGIYTFEPSIASEEFTRDHYNDGIRFDKVATIGKTSALQGFPNYDINALFTDTLVDDEFASRGDAVWAKEGVDKWTEF